MGRFVEELRVDYGLLPRDEMKSPKPRSARSKKRAERRKQTSMRMTGEVEANLGPRPLRSWNEKRDDEHVPDTGLQQPQQPQQQQRQQSGEVAA